MTFAWRHTHFSSCNVSDLSRAKTTTASFGYPLTCGATMPPNRTSRSRSIPQNLIVNWRPSDLRDGAKPLLRRPVTACDACRNAKAKCSGKDCNRCSARGLVCTYASQVALNRGRPRGDGAQPPPPPATWPMEDNPQGVPAVIHAGSTTAESSPRGTEDHQPNAALESNTTEGWTNDPQHQSMHPFNSSLLDLTSDVSIFEISLNFAFVG